MDDFGDPLSLLHTKVVLLGFWGLGDQVCSFEYGISSLGLVGFGNWGAGSASTTSTTKISGFRCAKAPSQEVRVQKFYARNSPNEGRAVAVRLRATRNLRVWGPSNGYSPGF